MTDRNLPSSNRPASETLRKKIMVELESRMMTARDLSKRLRATEKDHRTSGARGEERAAAEAADHRPFFL